MKKVLSVVLAVVMLVSVVTTAFATTVVPSIGQHDIEIVPVDEDYAGYIHTQTETIPVPFEDLIVTNVVDAEDAFDEHITIALESAMTQITEAESMADLCEELNDLIKKKDPNLTAENYVIYDLFDATLVNEYLDQILHDDYANNIEITFDIGLNDTSEKPVFMYADEEGEWHLIDDESVVVNPDNTVTVFFLEICPIAILMTASGVVIENPDVESPQTGVNWMPYIVCGAAAVLALCAFAVITSKKRA